MDIQMFTDQKTGQLIKIDIPVEDWAFLPDPLPPSWAFPEHLWPLVANARDRLGELNGIGRTLPNPELLFHPLRNREALRSSSLEGTYATPEELLLFELNPREPQSKHDRANDWQEVFNYGKTLQIGCDLITNYSLNLGVVRQMHAALLKSARGRDKSPGEFRIKQNHIGSTRRFIPPPPHLLSDCLEKLQNYWGCPGDSYDPLVRAFLVHYQFEAIHPFMDGNGRLGRALLSLMIYKAFDHQRPWLYMSSYFERYKDEYIDRLFDVSAKGDWTGWIEFCLRGTIAQAEDAIKRCELLSKMKDKFHTMVGNDGTRMHTIIEDLFQRPVVTIPSVARKFSISYNSARRDIQALVDVKVLQVLEGEYPKAFFPPELFAVAFNDSIEEFR